MEKLVKRESAHIQLYEIVLQECIKKGLLVNCNTKAVANLIKVMVDAWVLKRWDLRGHVTQLEMEKSIIDLVFNGLIDVKASKSGNLGDMGPLEEKVVLFVNGETVLGEAIFSLLLSKGAELAIYLDGIKRDKDFPDSIRNRTEKVRFYPTKKYGPLTQNLLRKIVDDSGPLDIVIQDLGTGNIETKTSDKNIPSAGRRLEKNFSCAQDIAKDLATYMNSNGCVRVVYLAPWAWHRYEDSLGYETVKSGAIALTQTMAKIMAALAISVNYIIPGFIRTNQTSKIEKDRQAEFLSEIPFDYLGEISDVLEAVSFFISNSSRYLTGQILEVTGGMN